MVDWGSATSVAVSGIFSVFAVLVMLQISITVTGSVIDGQAKRQAEKQKSQ